MKMYAIPTSSFHPRLVPLCALKASTACTTPTKISSHAMNVATAIAARKGSPIASVPQMISSTPHRIAHFDPCLMTANGLGNAVAIIVLSGQVPACQMGWKAKSAHCDRGAYAGAIRQIGVQKKLQAESSKELQMSAAPAPK